MFSLVPCKEKQRKLITTDVERRFHLTAKTFIQFTTLHTCHNTKMFFVIQLRLKSLSNDQISIMFSLVSCKEKQRKLLTTDVERRFDLTQLRPAFNSSLHICHSIKMFFVIQLRLKSLSNDQMSVMFSLVSCNYNYKEK